MNKALLFGNVGQDPEVRTTESGKKVAKFSFATTEHRTKDGHKITETTWHNIIAWEKLAELCEKWVKKGSSLIIEGRIVYRSYDDKNGVTKHITEIVATGLHFAGSKKDENRTALDLAKETFDLRNELHEEINDSIF